METIIKLVGIFSELFLIAINLICWRIEKKFNFRKEAFSYFGTSKKTLRIFNIGLFICTLLRLIFVGKVINYFFLWKNFLIVSTYASGLITLFISAVIPWNKYRSIHEGAAKGITISSVLFILFYGLFLIKSHFYLAVFNLIMFFIMSALAIYFLKTKKVNGIPQIIFLAFIMLWDWVITLELFNIIKL